MYSDANNRTDRPWGSFYILEDEAYTKVKRLVVNPGHRLSLQSHEHRDEHWVIVRGMARVTLNGATTDHHYGEHIFIRRGTRHRVACLGPDPVELIEVQVGDSFAEEDIVRYEDDYQRA